MNDEGRNEVSKYFSYNEEPDHETEEAEPEVIRTDADTVKELVEMKFLTNNT